MMRQKGKMLKGKKIAVLMGGLSSEREISLRSGKAVLNALVQKGYKAIGIDANRNIAETLKKKKIQVVFNVLHGRYGEDGAIQGTLELLGIPYTGSGIQASAIAMDKPLAKTFFEKNNVPTPKYYVLRNKEAGGARLSLPLIVKPASEGSTIGVTVVDRKSKYAKAVKEAYKYGHTVIVEEFIKGRELTVGVIDGRALPVVEVAPKTGIYDYKSKYTKGMTEYKVPAVLTPAVEKKVKLAAVAAYRSLGCEGASRVDVMLNKKGDPYVLEVNTVPGMTELSLLPKAAEAMGLAFPELVEGMLLSASLNKGA